MPRSSSDTKVKKKSKKQVRKELVDFIVDKMKEINLACNLSPAALSFRDVLIITTKLQNQECLNQSLFFSISQLLAIQDTAAVKD
jgi:hypothetical protein